MKTVSTPVNIFTVVGSIYIFMIFVVLFLNTSVCGWMMAGFGPTMVIIALVFDTSKLSKDDLVHTQKKSVKTHGQEWWR